MKIFIFVLLLMVNAGLARAEEPDFSKPLQTKPSPVVVELFSSQNCPACPPADAYMATLVKSKGVIALSCHVDYFGKTSAGLGREFCTDRQTKYIKQIGRKSHFTPQMMINGHMSEIGYERQKVSAKLVRGRSERVKEIIIKAKVSGVYSFTLPHVVGVEAVNLWLAIYDKPHEMNERGRHATYYNVVRRYIPMGQWNGSALTRAIFPIIDKNSAGFAIVAQEDKSGKVLAAGDFKL
jgi:hypothetical protein